MNEKICSDDLVVQLTIGQMRILIRDALQESSFLSKNEQKSEILTVEEVSELTGYKKATIYKLTHERKIPFHKPAHGGRRIFFKREEINQWLQSNRVETHEEFLKSWREENDLKTKKKTSYGKTM
ncbi:MAG: helix-turn-helix transcriptional regulator [Odoribacter splanchnicus]